MRTRIAMLLLAVCLFSRVSVGAEYFVNKQGNDANNGTARDTAFLTVQKGVNALQPGDTLTIGPGEYFESVTRDGIGSADVDTTIRAEIAGTATLRGDVPAPEFKPVEGYRFVCSAPFDQKPQAVLERDTLRVVREKASPSELEFDPGYFHYDETAKILYISRADLVSPIGHLYTVAVSEGGGLDITNPERLIIDGIAATGYYPQWGIRLAHPVSCVVRNCVGFMNVGGIVLEPIAGVGNGDGGHDNLVENCVAYGNSFGGIVRYGANNDVIRNSYCYMNVREGEEHFGFMHYAGMQGPLLMKDNIAWGQNFNFSVKPGGQQEKLENCVGLGFIRIQPSKMSHDLFDGGNEYGRREEPPADTVLFSAERDLNKDIEYADPLNLDFRLQPNSRFRGTAPDGTDRGPYQYKANIFYLSANGNDQADGLSSQKPWKTMARAVSGLRPGDTLYVMKGAYDAAQLKGAAGTAESPINIRGRGEDEVSVKGEMVLTGGSYVNFERVNFIDGLAIDGGSNVMFKNCSFAGAADGLGAQSVKGLRITHCVFTAPLSLATSSEVFIAGNVFENSAKPAVQVDSEAAILYSDYNNYKNPASAWQIGGITLAFADLQKRHDVYSKNIDSNDGVALKGQGFQGTPLGIYNEYRGEGAKLSLVGPFLHSTSDTTANIEWWASAPAQYSVQWGDTPEMKNAVSFRGAERFVSYSLTDLKPGQTYYFSIRSVDANDRATAVSMPVLNPTEAKLTFRTELQPAEARTYYVAPDGDNANDGLSREKAFKTVNRAAVAVGPGDTVLMYTGLYNETVRARAAGTKDRPITFRAAPGEKPAFNGDYLLRNFIMMFKPDYRFDALYLRAQEFWGDGYLIRSCPRVQITRCLNVTVTATDCPDIVVRNCVTRGGWQAIGLSQCPGAVVENNVSVMTILRHVVASSPNTVVRNNVFCDCIRNKMHQTLAELELPNVKESDNCFYVHWPLSEKLIINWIQLPIYQARTGSTTFAANPMMTGTPGFARGWQQSSDEDFDEFFTTNPELVRRGIGLQPEAFSDFKFKWTEWPYTKAWADAFFKAREEADASAEAEKNAEALSGYKSMVANMPMSDRVKSDVLERAFKCAMALKDYNTATQLAQDIPVPVLSIKRRMEAMLAQKQFAELTQTFSQEALGGRDFLLSYTYPEHEDVAVDLYYYRGLAQAELGNLDAAEADLTAYNAIHRREHYTGGVENANAASLRLADFYRDYRKDENKAVESYLEITKTVFSTSAEGEGETSHTLLGGTETVAQAVKAASEILTRQGKAAEAKKLQEDLAKAQAAVKAALTATGGR